MFGTRIIYTHIFFNHKTYINQKNNIGIIIYNGYYFVLTILKLKSKTIKIGKIGHFFLNECQNITSIIQAEIININRII